ncbi:hypothetical protein F4V43_09310 [Paenibacillus spiritus]|uniref:Uncharacterized protein n=1 Tax=Paenibacillus spiritus TaxID=2496557 RepID=A0A5J5GA99_9BACL|nr:hypothetical protein [Paenibacillus spiritus]KAA9004823.1 hypothetical protein F4V43_09310 [Paenibacillus spiritus]
MNHKSYSRLILQCITGLLAIVLFGLFVCPGLYRYDELEQKYPVRINRITGTTHVLVQGQWIKSEAKNAAYFTGLQQNSNETDYTITQMSSMLQQQLDLFRQQLEQDLRNVYPTPSPSFYSTEYPPLNGKTGN